MPDQKLKTSGLLGESFRGGLHMYHESLPPVIVHTAAEKAHHVELGFTESYTHHEYPKVIDGKTVKSAAEEAALKEAE